MRGGQLRRAARHHVLLNDGINRYERAAGPSDRGRPRRFIRRSLDIEAIPNGVDTAHFHPDSASDEHRAVHPTILFCGAMDYNPNIDALRWFFGTMQSELLAACDRDVRPEQKTAFAAEMSNDEQRHVSILEALLEREADLIAIQSGEAQESLAKTEFGL